MANIKCRYVERECFCNEASADCLDNPTHCKHFESKTKRDEKTGRIICINDTCQYLEYRFREFEGEFKTYELNLKEVNYDGFEYVGYLKTKRKIIDARDISYLEIDNRVLIGSEVIT